VSSYAGGRGEALPWWLVLVEGTVVALLGLVLLVAPGASLVFLVQLLGIYLLIAGIFRIIGIFLDSSSWGWKLAAATQQPSVEHHPGLYVVGHPRGVASYASGRCGPGSRFPRGRLGHGGLVRARHPPGPFLGDQPPDRGGGANVHLGDLHAHWGRGSGHSGIQDA
jgi:hypothetical protein